MKSKLCICNSIIQAYHNIS